MTDYRVEVLVPQVLRTGQGTLPLTNGASQWVPVGGPSGDRDEANIYYDALLAQGNKVRLVRWGAVELRHYLDDQNAAITEATAAGVAINDRTVVHPADLAEVMTTSRFIPVYKYSDGEPGEVGRVLGSEPGDAKRVFVSPEAPRLHPAATGGTGSSNAVGGGGGGAVGGSSGASGGPGVSTAGGGGGGSIFAQLIKERPDGRIVLPTADQLAAQVAQAQNADGSTTPVALAPPDEHAQYDADEAEAYAYEDAYKEKAARDAAEIPAQAPAAEQPVNAFDVKPQLPVELQPGDPGYVESMLARVIHRHDPQAGTRISRQL